MTEKETALEQIATLSAAHGITVAEIDAYLRGQPHPRTDKGFAARLLSYLGGAFVFSGVGLLISFVWEDVGSAQRVILTFGTGLSALVLAIACARDLRFERAAEPLFLVSAFMQPFGLFVFLDEYMPPTGRPALAAAAVFGTLALQHGLVFKVLPRSSLLFLSLVFVTGCLTAVFDVIGVDGDVTALAVGALVLATTAFIATTRYATITPFWYFLGGGLLIGGWWALSEGTALDITTLGVCVGLIALSIRVASRALLFVSVVGLLAYLSYFAYEYFADVVGWPIALILLGLTMMGVGGWAMKLGRRIAIG